jgi:hypothetical protein
MPAWTGCDVCELPQFRVQLTVNVPERFHPAGEDAPLPPGEYVLVPAETHDPTKEMHSPYRRGLPVVVKPIEGAPALEEARRDCMRAALQDDLPREG